MKKILITDQTHEVLPSRLREVGFDVSVEAGHTYESLIAATQGCQGLVVRSKVIVDRAFIDSVPSLRCIGRVGAGMETIDVDYAESKGIRCLNSPEGNRDAVGEHTVGLLLALLNNIARADAEVRSGLWQREANRGRELGSLTVGIVGFGNMGQAFARRLAGFGCRIIFYDTQDPKDLIDLIDPKALIDLKVLKDLNDPKLPPPLPPLPPSLFPTPVSLQELQRQADVVSFHVPLTDETHHYLDKTFIDSMAKPFFLLNTSRGAVVDTEALVDGLQSGKILGAALDVLEYENMQADALGNVPECVHYLQHSPRTVLTPHVAGWTVESKYKLAAVLADKMIEVLK